MKHSGLIAAGLTLVLLGAAPAPEEKQALLPGHKIPCDTKLLEIPDMWKIVKGDHDADKRQVRWLLEAQKDISDLDLQLQNDQWGGQTPMVYFFDADKVRILKEAMQVEGESNQYKKGERIRLILQLPDEETMGKVAAMDMRSSR